MKRFWAFFLMLMVLLAPCALAEELPAEKGSRGEMVQQIQQRLISLGLLDGSADGVFGAQTETAVKKLQKRCGLKENGIVDQNTYDALVEATTRTSICGYQEFLLILSASMQVSGLDAHVALPEETEGEMEINLSDEVSMVLTMDASGENLTAIDLRAELGKENVMDQICCMLVASGACDTITEGEELLKELGVAELSEGEGQRVVNNVYYGYQMLSDGALWLYAHLEA